MKNSIPNDNWIFLGPVDWPKLKKRINKQLERADKLIAKANSEEIRSIEKTKLEQITSTNNSSNLPSNATIREVYVRCGKPGLFAV
jgi:guanylate kinase